jgi:hypothetical protein
MQPAITISEACKILGALSYIKLDFEGFLSVNGLKAVSDPEKARLLEEYGDYMYFPLPNEIMQALAKNGSFLKYRSERRIEFAGDKSDEIQFNNRIAEDFIATAFESIGVTPRNMQKLRMIISKNALYEMKDHESAEIKSLYSHIIRSNIGSSRPTGSKWG